jgi:hypothetical protein
MSPSEVESFAIGYVGIHAKALAYQLLDGKFTERKRFKDALKLRAASLRHSAWMRAAACKFDVNRGCYLAINENPPCPYTT